MGKASDSKIQETEENLTKAFVEKLAEDPVEALKMARQYVDVVGISKVYDNDGFVVKLLKEHLPPWIMQNGDNAELALEHFGIVYMEALGIELTAGTITVNDSGVRKLEN